MNYYLFDIILFLITIVIILIYRYVDRKDRQIYLVKTFMDRMKQEIEDRHTILQESFDEISDTIELHEASVRNMLKRVDQSLEDLEKHASDLSQLQTYMSHYHRILKELSALTDKAEKRLSSLQEELSGLDQLEGRLQELSGLGSDLRADYEEFSQQFQTHKGDKLSELDAAMTNEFRKHLDAELARSESRISKARIAFEQEYDNAVNAFQHKVEILLEEARDAIEAQLSDSIDRIHSSVPESEQTPELESESDALDSEIASLARELGATVVSGDTADDGDVYGDGHDDEFGDEEEYPNELSDEEFPDEPVTDEEATFMFDMLDDDIVEEGVQEVEDMMGSISSNDALIDEEDEEASILDHAEHDDIDDGPMHLMHEDVDGDDSALDEICYDDEEEIILDDEDEETDELKPAAPAISPDKRSLVEEHLREGFSVSEIAELTDIPKGEIELIKELSEFSR